MKLFAYCIALASIAVCLAPAVAQENADQLNRLVSAESAPENWVLLESLDLSAMAQGWGVAQAGRTVYDQPLTLAGKAYAHGVGTHAPAEIMIELGGNAEHFVALAGVDDETKGLGTVAFEVWVDDALVAESPILKGGGATHLFDVNLRGAQRLLLVVTDANDGADSDHADWAGAMLRMKPGMTAAALKTIAALDEPPTPIASGTAAEPGIHGPRITGATPGRPFLFRIPATGEGQLLFSAEGLPPGLTLDTATGIITGSLQGDGEWTVETRVKSAFGSAARNLTIIGGKNKLALTPPMGWNSWNCWAVTVDTEKIMAAADAFETSGLAAHGYQYINIDDGWEDDRGADGIIRTNKKFKDMKALADYVHGKGLKLGIYSSPGPKTCAGYTGSYEHEIQDAQSYAEWGIDYLKHDWCSYGTIVEGIALEDLQKPYLTMRAALDSVNRDIVYSLCQYGMGKVWEWGADVGGNLWRTTGDISDSWVSMSNIGFSQRGLEDFCGPGRWNDPDMLVVGQVGWGPELRPSALKPNEQITHITLWTLQAAPLIIGCDLTNMDDFTHSLLTNDDVIDVNQDPLGKAAKRVMRKGRTEAWARPLFDGSIAVGLFNRGPVRTEIAVEWSELGLSGKRQVRDCWRRKALGIFENTVAQPVPAHGAVLLRISPVL